MESSTQATDLFLANKSPTTTAKKKRPGACTRCRCRKVKCDGHYPACGNCLKAGTECDINTSSTSRHILLKRVHYLEALIKDNGLEGSLQAEAEVSAATCPGMRHVQHSAQPPTQTLGNLSSLPQVTPTHASTGVIATHDKQQPIASAVSPSLTHDAANISAGTSPCGTDGSAIGVQQPIAHEVGMLSLSNSVEPKYVGPSSGLTFARLIYAAAPGFQGVPSNLSDPRQRGAYTPGIQQTAGASLPDVRDMHCFIDAYFDTIDPLYPFLSISAFSKSAERIRHFPTPQPTQSFPDLTTSDTRAIDHIDYAQLFLVLFLGASVLETRLAQDFKAESYLATAMLHVSFVSLHEGLRGLQTLLLLTLSSLHSPHGLNAWFLKSTILAGCIDLGLQRKRISPGSTSPDLEEHRIRSGIFWSAYSLDRTLSVVLGRPLTLRDEAIDIEFPDGLGSDEVDHEASSGYSTSLAQQESARKRQQATLTPGTPAAYSFRFDRTFAEIKLMLYRVAQSPSRFPWPTDFGEWQTKTHTALTRLLEDAHKDLNRLDAPRYSRGVHENAVLSIELKYHQAIMLLYRPSPAIPRPSALALKYCFESAVGTIQAQAELQRFGNFANSWLNAHTVFVSGITICYCLWVSQQIRSVTPATTFKYYADTVKRLLTSLSTTWSVASSALQKFEALVQLTESSSQLHTSDAVDMGDGPMMPSMASHGQGPWPALPQPGFLSDPDLDWSSFDVEYDNTNAWPQEMQEVPDLFSLADWLNDYSSTVPG